MKVLGYKLLHILWRRYLAFLYHQPYNPGHDAHMAVGVGFTFRDSNGNLVASIYPDEGTKVHQPDKIRSCGDALVEHLAEVAAQDAAQKWFEETP